MPFRNRTSRTFARDVNEIAFAAPEVVVRRVTQMWLAGITPSRRDRAEFHQMSEEKVAAFVESWQAMYLALFRTNCELAVSLFWWPWAGAASGHMPAHLRAHGRRAVAAVFGAGLAPIRRRAVANVKRLRREAA